MLRAVVQQGPLMSGVVEAFDGAAGLGTVLASDGSRYPFHCTSIMDGSRSIDVGRAVVFGTGFRVLRREAVQICDR